MRIQHKHKNSQVLEDHGDELVLLDVASEDDAELSRVHEAPVVRLCRQVRVNTVNILQSWRE